MSFDKSIEVHFAESLDFALGTLTNLRALAETTKQSVSHYVFTDREQTQIDTVRTSFNIDVLTLYTFSDMIAKLVNRACVRLMSMEEELMLYRFVPNNTPPDDSDIPDDDPAEDTPTTSTNPPTVSNYPWMDPYPTTPKPGASKESPHALRI